MQLTIFFLFPSPDWLADKSLVVLSTRRRLYCTFRV